MEYKYTDTQLSMLFLDHNSGQKQKRLKETSGIILRTIDPKKQVKRINRPLSRSLEKLLFGEKGHITKE